MTVARLSTSMIGASAVTFGLAFLMQGLVVFRDEVDLSDGPLRPMPQVFQHIVEPVPVKNDWAVEVPPTVIPPTTDPDPEKRAPTIDTTFSVTPPEAPPLGTETGPELGGLVDGNALPIVRVQPVYPRRALTQGVEGYAVVSLTINPDGTVDPSSIVILEAEPAGYFERAARDAAAKFKYKPRVVDGVAIPASGVQYKFTFALGDK